MFLRFYFTISTPLDSLFQPWHLGESTIGTKQLKQESVFILKYNQYHSGGNFPFISYIGLRNTLNGFLTQNL